MHQPVKKLQFQFFFYQFQVRECQFFLFTLPGNQKIIFLKALLSRWWFSSFLQVGYVPWRVGFKLGNFHFSGQQKFFFPEKTHEKPEEASLDCSFGMSVGDTQKFTITKRSVTCSDRIPFRDRCFGWKGETCVVIFWVMYFRMCFFWGVSKGHRFQIDIFWSRYICFFGEDKGEFSQIFFWERWCWAYGKILRMTFEVLGMKVKYFYYISWESKGIYQGTIGCTPNSVPMVFIVFSRDSWGL